MDIRLDHAQEEEIVKLASVQGRPVGDVARDLLAEGLRHEAFYRDKLERSIAQADRGEFVDEAEMDARFEAMIRPR